MERKIKNFICLIGIISALAQTAFANDFAEQSETTSEALKNALYYDLKGLADTFIYCEKEYNVNAIALAGIAAVESGWGTSNLAENKNNLFGWTNNNGKYREFESKKECIIYVAKSLSENYLNEDGKYYSGGTLTSHIGKYYCETEEWAEYVNMVIDQIEERCLEYELENICPS